jgi:Tfp pilus assembly protein PilF
MALNNLAYNLADRAGSPKEALPYAEQAYRVSKQAPLTTDTLGWVYHKLGDNLTAAAYLEAALRALPNNPDVLIHTATVHVALNDFVRARAELQRAERLGESVTARDDFRALAATLLPQ